MTFEGIYSDRDEAEQARDTLVAAGIPADAVSLSEATPSEDVPLVRVTGAHRIALGLGVGGTVVGMLVGALVGTGLLAHPLLGFLGPGLGGGLLKGAIGGAGFGTLFGYILGMGLWDDDGEVSTVAPRLRLAVTAEHAERARAVLNTE